jgi:hypothetical protein
MTTSERMATKGIARQMVWDTTQGALYVFDGQTYGGIAVGGGESGTPSSTVVSETTFNQTASAGVALAYSRGDHTHGTPADPVPAHSNLTSSAHGGILQYSGLAKITVGSSAPSNPGTGDLWVDTS